MNAEDVRARLMGTSPAAVEAAENRRQQEKAEDYKEKARARELPRSFGGRGKRGPPGHNPPQSCNPIGVKPKE